MAEEGKGIALTILGIVAVIAIVGLVLLFTGARTGQYAAPGTKIYGGPAAQRQAAKVFEERFIKPPVPEEEVAVVYGSKKWGGVKVASEYTTCMGDTPAGRQEKETLESRGYVCIVNPTGPGWCCRKQTGTLI